MKRYLALAALLGTLALTNCTNKSPSGSGAGPEDINPSEAVGNNPNSNQQPSDVPASSNGGQTISQDTTRGATGGGQ